MTAFRCVRVNVTTSKFLRRMGHCFMPASVFFSESTIGRKFIRDNARTAVYFLTDRALETCGGDISDDAAANLALALYGAKHWSLTGRPSDSAHPLVSRLARP